ncbi:hypothetical protein BH20ACT23_BH20ACT23_18660 [soil metagenome]
MRLNANARSSEVSPAWRRRPLRVSKRELLQARAWKVDPAPGWRPQGNQREPPRLLDAPRTRPVVLQALRHALACVPTGDRSDVGVRPSARSSATDSLSSSLSTRPMSWASAWSLAMLIRLGDRSPMGLRHGELQTNTWLLAGLDIGNDKVDLHHSGLPLRPGLERHGTELERSPTAYAPLKSRDTPPADAGGIKEPSNTVRRTPRPTMRIRTRKHLLYPLAAHGRSPSVCRFTSSQEPSGLEG